MGYEENEEIKKNTVQICKPKEEGTARAGMGFWAGLQIPLLLARGGEWAPRARMDRWGQPYIRRGGWGLEVDAGLPGIMRRRVPST